MTNRSFHNTVLENAKFILIFLVVLGHSIEATIFVSPELKSLYSTIYSFHMPTFILISGMLSKNELNRAGIKTLAKRLLLPLFIFTIIYETYHFALFRSFSYYITTLKPYWILWYLVSLFIWRITLPLFRNVPALILLPTSVAVSVLFSLIPNIPNTFGIARTLHFWPFFLMGFFMTPRLTEMTLFRKIPRSACFAVLVSTFYLFWVAQDFNAQILYGSHSYTALGLSNIVGIQIKCLSYIGSIILCFAVLRLVPASLAIPQSWTKNTLYVYLWHGLPLKTRDALGLQDLTQAMPFSLLLLYHALGALLLVVLLSNNTVKASTDRLALQN